MGEIVLGKMKNLCKKETVFCVSFMLALLSMLFVTPDLTYLNYPDYRTLSLLFSLMIVVAGLQSLGIFERLGNLLMRRAKGAERLTLTLILLCFFSSMIITNDVALITFVPFSILVCRMIKREDLVMRTVIMETIAANLGSMATPIGNPQNLYLFTASTLSLADFARATWPYALISLLLIILFHPRGTAPIELRLNIPQPLASRWPALIVYLIMLGLSLLVVFRVLPFLPVLAITILGVLFVDRRLFLQVDYFLLLTFLCFFIFIGNMERIPSLQAMLRNLVSGRELIAGVLCSQFISNVPAAMLLSGFASDMPALLTGVNLGGLGTLIASLASLISFKYFASAFPQQKGRYLRAFTLWNLLFLLVLVIAAVLLGAQG